MIFDYETLKFIWLLLIGALLIGFAITGGFDLGICALLPFIGKNDLERRLILNSIGPTWEGNQVWLITAAGAIFAAWPLMYAATFSSFYVVLLFVLIPLILRPPSIDFRSKFSSPTSRSLWDFCLFLSGFMPAFLFGVVFGNLLQGISFNYDNSLIPQMNNSFLSFLSPYTLTTGIISLTLLLLHGSLFLQLKTVSPIHERAIKAARGFGFLFIMSFAMAWGWTVFKIEGFQIISMPNPNESFTPFAKQVIKGVGLWLNNYHQYPLGYLAPVLSIMGVLSALFFSARQMPILALLCNSLAVGSTIVTAGFTLFPFILPSVSFPHHSLTIWDAASSQLTLSWMFWATLLLLPMVLLYTAWAFRVMHGKVTEIPPKGESY